MKPPIMRRVWIGLLAVIAAITVGYWLFGYKTDQVSERLHRYICASGAQRVALADTTDFDWDHVVILTPYKDRQTAEKALGFPWPDYPLYEKALVSEARDILIFLRHGRIVRVVDHPRGKGDFSDELGGKRLSRSEAVFAIRREGITCNSAVLFLPKDR